MNRFKYNFISALCISALTLTVTGCNDDDNNSSTPPTPPSASTKITGTAAVGAAIAGANVTLNCGGGSNANTTTNTSGVFNASVPTASLPCAASVSGGSLPTGQTLHSVTTTTGSNVTLNVNPLTDLVLIKALQASGVDAAAWLTKPVATNLPTTAAIAAASAALKIALTAKGYTWPATANFDPITSAILPATPTDAYDSLLDALGSAFVAAATTYPQFVSSFIGGGSFPVAPTTPPVTPPVTPLVTPTTISASGSITTANTKSPNFSPNADGFEISVSDDETEYRFIKHTLSGNISYTSELIIITSPQGQVASVSYSDAKNLGITDSLTCNAAMVACQGVSIHVSNTTKSVALTFNNTAMSTFRSRDVAGTLNGTLTGSISNGAVWTLADLPQSTDGLTKGSLTSSIEGGFTPLDSNVKSRNDEIIYTFSNLGSASSAGLSLVTITMRGNTLVSASAAVGIAGKVYHCFEKAVPVIGFIACGNAVSLAADKRTLTVNGLILKGGAIGEQKDLTLNGTLTNKGI